MKSRTCAASFPWRARSIRIPPAASFSSALATRRFLDRQYTAFGKLIKGDDVLGKIGDTPDAPAAAAANAASR